MFLKKYSYYLILLSIFLISSCTKVNSQTSIPKSSGQMVLVLTDSTNASKGLLYYFERNSQDSDWKIIGDNISVVLGRNGLGWGTGLQNFANRFNYPNKVEGDGEALRGFIA